MGRRLIRLFIRIGQLPVYQPGHGCLDQDQHGDLHDFIHVPHSDRAQDLAAQLECQANGLSVQQIDPGAFLMTQQLEERDKGREHNDADGQKFHEIDRYFRHMRDNFLEGLGDLLDMHTTLLICPGRTWKTVHPAGPRDALLPGFPSGRCGLPGCRFPPYPAVRHPAAQPVRSS